jgi:hypothetical protein
VRKPGGKQEYERLLRAGVPEREARANAGLPCLDPTEEDLHQMALNRVMAEDLKSLPSPRDLRDLHKAIRQQMKLRDRVVSALARGVLSIFEASTPKARLTLSNQFSSASATERARAIDEVAASYWLPDAARTALGREALTATTEADIHELVAHPLYMIGGQRVYDAFRNREGPQGPEPHPRPA